MIEPHPFEPQWEWLQKLPCGSRVIARGRTWLKVNLEGGRYFVDMETGEGLHFSFLADDKNPPREECHPSPFSV